MWEMIMEYYRPSINDLITTTCGGITYGEIGYRFSSLVRKRSAHGLERVWREAVGTLLNPVGSVNRLVDSRKAFDPTLPGSEDVGRILNGELMLTGPVIIGSDELAGTRAAPLLGFALTYGDRAGAGWTGRPFDVFDIEGRLRWGPDHPHLSLFIYGALAGRPSTTSLSGPAHFFGLYQQYEDYGFDTMRLAGTSFSGGWTSRIDLRSEARITTSARFGWLGLGASDDFLAEPGERQAYNMATGIAAAADLTLSVRKFDYAKIVWHHYNLFDLNVRGSRVGRETWDILQAQIELPILAGFGLGGEVEYCSRRFDPRDFPGGHRALGELKAFVAWQF
jgi:hypothetical protein